MGHHDAAGRFRIDGVTGPDEYSAIADNNVYTNLMAERNLRAAFDAVQRHPQRAAELGVDDEEAAGWRDAAQAMLIPYDEELGVHPQAEAFTEHEIWDFDATAPEQYPLLLHFPYFDLYRKQVVKQADLVLALHLRGDAFSDEEKARDFAYYERLTVRDSSLSACTQAVIAAEVGHLELAYDYLSRGRAHRSRRPPAQHARRAAHRIAGGDMDRRRRGVWRDARPRRDPELRTPPAPGAHPAHVPPLLPRAKAAGGGRTRAGDLLAAQGRSLEIVHHGKKATVNPQRPLTRPIPPPPARETPSQPTGRAPQRREQPSLMRQVHSGPPDPARRIAAS